jgi:gamma-glutamyltranspeptidase/glutathione hydrolase
MDEALRILTRPDGTPLRAGDRFVQPELAKTLGLVADGGAKAFYEGPLADTLVREVQKGGGIWSREDLAQYHAVVREPIVFSYRGHEIIAMPPPSAGGIVLRQLLGAAEDLSIEKRPWRSADEVHLFAEAMRRTYADRNELLGDPDFVKIPMKELLDPAYVKRRVSDVDPDHATPSSHIKAGIEGPPESTQTTHYSVVDEAGDAVSNTYTLNTGYGSKFVVPGTGVLLNNEMDDFATKPGSANVFGLVQGEKNKIEPRKRMLSSMTPTIVVKDGELRAVLGSPGGPTISTTVAQIVRGLVDYGRPLDEVIPAFRAHHQWLPDQITTEPGMPKSVEEGLVAKGHVVKRVPRIGHANCIEIDPATHGFRAVADTTRGGGKAATY